MIQCIDDQSNWETFKYIWGVVSGIAFSSIGFLFTHRYNWRNYLTGEIKISLKYSYTNEDNGDVVKSIGFIYQIDCTNSDEFTVNYIYFEIPKNITGNIPPNATLGEAVYENKGKYYIKTEKINFKHSLIERFALEDSNILSEIKKKNIREITLIVNTSKYGNLKSNKIKLLHTN